jgi:glutamate/tyrosine decarboxylase-like PLP-dependent enzyme
VETVAARWLLELLDLPRESSVGFVTGATIANFVCLAAARGEILRNAGWNVEADGLFGAPLISVVIGDDAHTSNFSALQFLGLGHDRVIRIATNRQGVMIPEALSAAVGGLRGPLIVIMQAGQLNTGGFDQFEALIPIAHKAGAWVHIDGAFGLWARACPTRKHLTDGVDQADSWATDGHKWLQTPYDSGYAIVKNETAHRRAMAINASYLQAASTNERNPTDYVPELSRKARGFATWAIIKALGQQGIAEMVERHCQLALQFSECLRREPGVAIMNDVVINQVIVRFGSELDVEAGDALTQKTIAFIQRDGICFAGGAQWRGQLVMRLSVISFDTMAQDIETSAAAIIAAYREAKQQG